MWRGGHMGQFGAFVFCAVLLAACSSEPGATNGGETIGETSGDSGPVTSQPEDTLGPEGDCDIPDGQPFEEGDSVEVAELGTVNGATISGALYPRPDYEGNPWSQWGQGIALEDGRFYSAIGDHLGVDGNSYIYEYDPATSELSLVGDILSHVDHEPGTWGYGKIHSQMVPGPCGEVYFSTYWGTSSGLEFEGNYTGDLIFRLDPFGRTMEPLTVPIEFHGQASLGADPTTGLIYGEAVDPIERDAGGMPGPFFAYDVSGEATVFVSDIRSEVGYRSVLVDEDGVAYWSIGGGELQAYDPITGESTTHDSEMPGDWLRAVTEPGPDGTVYGVTREPDVFFAMSPDGEITGIGDALGYTASMALAPDGAAFFYMPGAHGNSSEWGSPLMSVDTSTGEQTVVAELNELVMSEFGYRAGGTYNIAVSSDGERVLMGVNVGLGDESFGEVILLVIDLP